MGCLLKRGGKSCSQFDNPHRVCTLDPSRFLCTIPNLCGDRFPFFSLYSFFLLLWLLQTLQRPMTVQVFAIKIRKQILLLRVIQKRGKRAFSVLKRCMKNIKEQQREQSLSIVARVFVVNCI